MAPSPAPKRFGLPVTPYAHDETGDHWIVVVPNPEFSGKRLGVTFIEGEARTTDILRAREFSEVLGYTVTPFAGAPAWTEATEPPTGGRPEWAHENSPKTAIESAEARAPQGQFAKSGPEPEPLSTINKPRRGRPPKAATAAA